LNKTKLPFRVNNFDLIRLMAAMQVAVIHSMVHMQVGARSSFIYSILHYFPGVPIFFFVSGFLISKSYENNSVLKEYAQNRIFRIYPALIVCTFLAITGVYLSGYFANVHVGFDKIALWIAAQISFVQFYNPAYMHGFGVGVLNGSLWTISVELQFYFLIPILYGVFGLSGADKKNKTLITLIALFVAANAAYYGLIGTYGENLFFKLWGVSFAPWLHMFLVGVFFQRNFDTLYRFLQGKVAYILCMYLPAYYVSVNYFGWTAGNKINIGLYVLLAGLVFSLAYSFPTLSAKALRGNDVSYGVYIYHMPIVNLLIYFGYVSSAYYLAVAFVLTALFAASSWLIIEKPCMKFKKHPLRPLVVADEAIGVNSGVL
jgi:peptidoglycan/LPS O-acetylase OafA/YrhL